MERIVEAAILQEGIVYRGKRHHECIAKIRKETGQGMLPYSVQGFLTNLTRFVDREEAARIALACGQIEKLKYHSKKLFSEDLY